MIKLPFKKFKLEKSFSSIPKLLGVGTRSDRGFTLVETLIAIFILAMAITSAMTVASSGLQASFYARDRIAAYFLAQEAIEMIKNKRDENGIKNYQDNNTDWLDGIADWAPVVGFCGESGGNSDCGPDSYNDTIVDCDNYENCDLYQDTSNNIFQYVADGNPETLEKTKFKRVVNMKKINDDEAKVTVTVSWPGRSFSVTEHVLNWHPLSDCLTCTP